MQDKNYAEYSQGALCISLSGRFRQVLLYSPTIDNKNKYTKQFAKITLFTLDNSQSLQ